MLTEFIDKNDNENVSADRDKFWESRLLLTNDIKLKQSKISDFFKWNWKFKYHIMYEVIFYFFIL